MKLRAFITVVLLVALCCVAVLPTGCRSREAQEAPAAPGAGVLSLSSTAFGDGEAIPDKYTCQGEDLSLPLSWGDVPAEARSLVLVVEDLDTSNMFTHWVIFDIPTDTDSLPEALSFQAKKYGTEGKNDFGDIGYGGPCPPPGKPHRYRFLLYALDTVLNLEEGVAKRQVLEAIEGHVLAQGQLVGTYQR